MKKITLILCILGLLVGCSSEKKNPLDKYQSIGAAELFHRAEQSLAKGSYGAAVTDLEALDNLYPFGKYADQAQLDIIYAYYKDDDMAEALAAADRYIHLNPRSEHVDYAYYMKGLVTFKQGMTWLQEVIGVDPVDRDSDHLTEAYAAFNQLVENSPDSPYYNDSVLHMQYIRNSLAKSEYQVAQYYMYHKAYTAVINRNNYILQHYQGTPSVVKALVLNVKAYRALKLDKLAEDNLKTLELNYPDAKQLKRLKKH